MLPLLPTLARAGFEADGSNALGVEGAVVAAEAMKAPFDELPLVIGVTGHRDPPAEAEGILRERFADVIQHVRLQHPSMPLLVISGLAAGADMWAAEEALARGVAVLGCLPMSQPEYERDFTPEETIRFRSILPRCWDVVVVGTSAQREQNYVDVADFVAYYSHVLVAFWDGRPSRGPGGTAEVVELRESGLPSVIGDALIAYVPDVGPVFHIVTPRRGRERPPECFSIRVTYPERLGALIKTKASTQGSGEAEFEKMIANLERFNRDLSCEKRFSEPDQLATLRDRADAAANGLQRRTVRSLQSVYLATALAGAAQLILPTDGSFNIPGWAGIVAKLGFLAIAFVVLAIARRNDFENRYQDYRAIAEALRVQYAWCCAGLRKRLVEASYLEMQQSELEWIRLALRTAYLVTGLGGACPADGPEHSETTRWIDGQTEYYRRSGEREESYLRRSHVAILVAAIGGGLVSAAAAVLAWMVSHNVLTLPAAQPANALHILEYWAVMPFALGSLLALLIRFYVQQRGFAENARRYQHMFLVFTAAGRRLREGNRDPLKVLEQLGHESLSEHAAWLILHRERPLSFVHV